MSKKTNIVFVCTLNTQRSALCQFILEKYAGDRFNVSSSGLIRVENGVLSESVKNVLYEYEKIPKSKLNEFRTTHFDKEIGEKADLIVCVTREHASAIYETFPDLSNKVTYFEKPISDSCSTEAGAFLCMMRIKENLKEMFDIDFDSVQIKKMTKSNVIKAQMIENMSFTHPFDLNEALSDGKMAYCAYLDGNLCGYICSYYVLDENNILTIAVSEKYRHRGIGEKLLRYFIEESKKIGIKNIYLEVRYSNTNAILLYEKVGFVKSGLRRDYYTDPKEDGILYTYEIKE